MSLCSISNSGRLVLVWLCVVISVTHSFGFFIVSCARAKALGSDFQCYCVGFREWVTWGFKLWDVLRFSLVYYEVLSGSGRCTFHRVQSLIYVDLVSLIKPAISLPARDWDYYDSPLLHCFVRGFFMFCFVFCYSI